MKKEFNKKIIMKKRVLITGVYSGKAYYEKNKDKIKAYYEKNKDKIAKYSKATLLH
jgi:hypothetical protein